MASPATKTWLSVVSRLRSSPREAGLLLAALLSVGALWIFVAVADEVILEKEKSVDSVILLAFRDGNDLSNPIGPPWIHEVARDVTALGSVTVLAILTVVVASVLWLLKHRTLTFYLVGCVAGGNLVSQLMKTIFSRPRPDLVPKLVQVYSASFPSGHSMMATTTYLTLAALTARLLPTAGMKLYVLAVALGLALLVGVSRVYLGVHWPSDVLAGWALGTAWALICWSLSEWRFGKSPRRRT